MNNIELYHIDNLGFLLDQQGYYLVNSKGDGIKLSQRELSLLRNAGLLT